MKILGTYSIDLGKGFLQVKNLISQSDFTNIVLPNYAAKSVAELKKDDKEVKRLSQELNDLFGEYFFTDESPVYKSISDDTLHLPKIQGGDHYCKITLIEPEKKSAQKEDKKSETNNAGIKHPKDMKILAYKSLVTGKEYAYTEYSNHGTGEIKTGDYSEHREFEYEEHLDNETIMKKKAYPNLSVAYGREDLPKEEYPCTYIYKNEINTFIQKYGSRQYRSK